MQIKNAQAQLAKNAPINYRTAKEFPPKRRIACFIEFYPIAHSQTCTVCTVHYILLSFYTILVGASIYAIAWFTCSPDGIPPLFICAWLSPNQHRVAGDFWRHYPEVGSRNALMRPGWLSTYGGDIDQALYRRKMDGERGGSERKNG